MADYDCQSYIDRYPLLQKKFGTSCENEETRTKAYEHWTKIGSKEGLIAAYADKTAMDTQTLYILNPELGGTAQKHRDAATKIGATLASVHSIAEEEYIQNMVKDSRDGPGGYFLGLQPKGKTAGVDDCCWKLDDGSKLEYNNWNFRIKNRWNNNKATFLPPGNINVFGTSFGSWWIIDDARLARGVELPIVSVAKKQIPHSNSVTFPNTGTKEFMYKSKLIDEILKDRRFEINVDLKISGAQDDYRNIFFYGNSNVVRVPAMWVFPKADKWMVHFVASRSKNGDNWNLANSHINFNIPDKFRNFGETLRIKVQFYEMDNSFLLVAYVNGEEVKIQEFEGKFYRKEEQILRIQDTRFHKRNGVEVSNLTLNKFQPQVFDLQAILDRNIQQKQKEEFSNYSIGKEEMSSMTTKTSMQPAPVQRPLQSGQSKQSEQPTLEGMSIIEGNTNPTIGGILTRQNDVKNIVEHETDRLNAKKAHVDGVLFSQKRELDLNESHRLKHRYYLYIFIILVCAMVAYILVAKLRESLTFIPDMVFDIMVILTIIIPGFLIYFTIMDIRRRDHMDFSKLNLHAPKQRSEEEINAAREKAVKDGDLSALTKLCSGEECCPAPEDGSSADVNWNPNTGRCIVCPAGQSWNSSSNSCV